MFEDIAMVKRELIAKEESLFLFAIIFDDVE